ncbi:beta strand repeat-containing protein [Humisphaera borealis]|uniref:Autotransporter-associated beta strand repeat-containing protein n=1 Tax=Humisphaera borealis TaxID=2807512 RepID=A0A7M2WXJ7_9BACT|nr:autotransporter-associated beta strand repeat-containing protein [Humisphaera borealis]QOV90248.1 autotransporter-associated beta strand repeat-containing protein [Humisphaera borealis]
MPTSQFPGTAGLNSSVDLARFSDVDAASSFVSIDASPLTDSALSLGGIDFSLNAGTGLFSIGGGAATATTVRLNGTEIDTTGTNTSFSNNVLIAVTDAATRDLTIAPAVNAATGTLSLQLGLTNGGFYVANGRVLTLSTSISQSLANSGFTKTGAGTLVLSGSNTFTGKAAVNGGILQIGADNNLGTAPAAAVSDQLSLNSATLKLSAALTLNANRGVSIAGSGATIDTTLIAGTGNSVIAGVIAGTAPLFLAANGNTSDTGGGQGGNLALTGANTFVGNVTISSGVVTAASNFGNASNKIIITGGGLVASATTTLPSTRLIELSGTGDRILRSYGVATFTLNGVVSGSGNLRATDSGVLILAAANTYTGATIVGGGTLTIGSGTTGSIVTSSGLSILGSNTARIARTDNVSISSILPASITFAGTGSRLELASTLQTSVLTIDRDIGSGTTAGRFRVSGGNVTLASGTDISVAAVSLGLQTTTNRGVLNIGTGSTVAAATFDLGESSNNSGTINQTGGTVTAVSGGFFRLGHWTNGTNAGSQYNLSGGTLDATALSANAAGSAQILNVGWDGQGTMVVGGGASTATLKAFGIQLDANGDTAAYNSTLTLSPNGVVEVASSIGGGSALDRFFLAGGTLRPTANNTWSNRFEVTATSAIDLNGKTVSLTGGIEGSPLPSITSASAGALNVSGTLTAGQISLDANSTLGFTNTTTMSVSTVFSGAGSIAKSGSGTVSLTATSTLNGATNVSGGLLNVVGSLASSAVTVTDTGTIGGEGTVGSLTLGATTGATLQVDPTTPGALNVVGNLALNGVTTIQLTSATTGTAPFTVLNFGSLTGSTANLTLANLAGFRTPELSLSGNSIIASIGNLNLTWTGSVGSTWDAGATANTNWTDGSSQNFFSGDNVTFNDSSTIGGVTLAGSISPGSVTVNSSTTAYTITASTGNVLAGPMTLLKRGTSTLVMAGNVANTYAGGTLISAGAIDIQNAGSLGTGTITLGDANTGSDAVALYLATNRSTVTAPVVIAAAGTGTATLGSRSSVTGTGANNQFNSITINRAVVFDSNAADRTDYRAISGTGNILVTGSGRSIFSVVNTFVGDLTVGTATASSGTLQLGTNSTAFDAIPNGSNVTIAAGGLLNLSYTAGGSETINALNGTGTLGNNGGLANTIIIGSANGSGDFGGLIRNGGAAALSVTKSGSGTQILGGTNTYTGVTTINGGTLSVALLANGGTASNIGQATALASNLVIGGGTLAYTGATVSINRAFTTSAASAIDIPTGTNVTLAMTALNSTDATTIAATTGFQPVLGGTLTKTGGGSLIMTGYRGGSAAATSDMVINGGNVTFGTGYFNAAPFGQRALTISVNSGGSVTLNTSHAIGGDNADLGTSWGQIFVNGGTLTTNGDNYLSGGTVSSQGRLVLTAGAVNGSGNLRTVDGGSTITTVASATASLISAGIQVRGNIVLDVARGAADSDLTITGLVSNSTTGGLVKSGSGILTLTRANTYAGTTTINAGTLLANNDPLVAGSATSSSSVSVAGTSRLGGTGRVGGAASFAAGTTLAPGAVDTTGSLAGELRFGGDVTMAANSTYQWQISDPGVGAATDPGEGVATAGGSFDKVTIAGVLTIAPGDTVNIAIEKLGSFAFANDAFYRWQVATSATTTVTASQFVLPGISTDESAAYDVEVVGNSVFVTFDETRVVPEPTTGMLGVVAMTGLLARRRRQSRRS